MPLFALHSPLWDSGQPNGHGNEYAPDYQCCINANGGENFVHDSKCIEEKGFVCEIPGFKSPPGKNK